MNEIIKQEDVQNMKHFSDKSDKIQQNEFEDFVAGSMPKSSNSII